MRIKAYAKLNLYLDITGRIIHNKKDYHSLETVMISVDLADDISVSVTEAELDSVEIVCDNPEIPVDERNIAHLAAVAFLRRLGFIKKYKIVINIKKNIPVGGGLGGSSTDGAAVLVALNRFFGNPLCEADLLELGADLGADVPFCITGGACACTGIGNKIKRLTHVSDCYFVIVKPDFSFSSKEAYLNYDKNPTARNLNFDKFIEAINKGRLMKENKLMYNAFEHIHNNRKINDLKQILIKFGAENALMTGSGSAVFGMFGDFGDAKRAVEELKKILCSAVFLTKCT